MQRDLILDGLRFKLAEQYRENPTGFLSLSKEAINSALAREIVAKLRNEGHVEEEVRAKSGSPRAATERFRTIRYPILIERAHNDKPESIRDDQHDGSKQFE